MSGTINKFLKRKKEAKKALAGEFSFDVKKPLVGLFLDKRLGEEDEVKVKYLLDGLGSLNVSVLVLTDEEHLESFSFEHVRVMPFTRLNRKMLLEASDIAVSFPFSDVEEMLLNGAIPVSCERPEIEDYNPNAETGNAFVYGGADVWAMFAALVRAVETFKFPYDWKHLVRKGVGSVKK